MLKVLSVFGTRPEAIKMAPVLRQLERYSDRVRSVVCVTAQHRQMLDQVLSLFAINPQYDLNLMRPNQSPLRVMSAIFEHLEPILTAEKPDWVLVQGDTTTVMAAALAAFHQHIRVGHIEAGLRTGDKYHPFPEEINRRIADLVADLYFAPTPTARDNLLREGIEPAKVLLTGNTVIDALLDTAGRPYDWTQGELSTLPRTKRLILVTAHRRENFGAGIESICAALRALAHEFGDSIQIIFPVHPNPNIHEVVHRMLGGLSAVSLLPPLDYLPLVQIMKHAALILTDSGGLQEEAPSLGVPVLVMRSSTERPEAIQAGTAKLVGTDQDTIYHEARRLLTDPAEHARMVSVSNPYGDGHAAERIVNALLEIASL